MLQRNSIEAEIKHKVKKKILFSLLGITEKARDLCKKERIAALSEIRV